MAVLQCWESAHPYVLSPILRVSGRGTNLKSPLAHKRGACRWIGEFVSDNNGKQINALGFWGSKLRSAVHRGGSTILRTAPYYRNIKVVT